MRGLLQFMRGRHRSGAGAGRPDSQSMERVVRSRVGGCDGGAWRRWCRAAGRDHSGRAGRCPQAAHRTPIPYRCQALDQAPHGPVYPCDTAFPLVAVCSAWRFVWI